MSFQGGSRVCDHLPVAFSEALQPRLLMPVPDLAKKMPEAGRAMGPVPAALHGVQDPENDQEHQRSPQRIRSHRLSSYTIEYTPWDVLPVHLYLTSSGAPRRAAARWGSPLVYRIDVPARQVKTNGLETTSSPTRDDRARFARPRRGKATSGDNLGFFDCVSARVLLRYRVGCGSPNVER